MVGSSKAKIRHRFRRLAQRALNKSWYEKAIAYPTDWFSVVAVLAVLLPLEYLLSSMVERKKIARNTGLALGRLPTRRAV